MTVPKEDIIYAQLSGYEQLMKLLVVMYLYRRVKYRDEMWLGFTIAETQERFAEHFGVRLSCATETMGLTTGMLTLCAQGLVQEVSTEDSIVRYFDLTLNGVDWGSKIYHAGNKGDVRFERCVKRSSNPTKIVQMPVFTPAGTW